MEFDPEIQHHFGGGVYAKEMKIPKGYSIIQHAHRYDHLSVLAKGTAQVVSQGYVSTYNAPACITIPAGKLHGIEAVTDVLWYCIHATECDDPEEVDEQLIVKG